MYASNSGVPDTASGPSTDALIESVSLEKITPPVCTEACERSRSAVDAEPVKATTSPRRRCVEQGRHASRHQLERALGQQPGLDQDAHHGFGEVSGWGGRLHESRHAGDEGRRELLERAPDREVEGVDLHRDAGQARVDVAADEAAVLRERLDRAVDVDLRVGQLAAALRRVGEEHADAAVDVDPRVVAGRAGAGREGVQLLLALGEHERHLLEQHGALVEGQLAEGGLSDGSRVLEGAREVEALGADLGDELTGGGVADRGGAGGGRRIRSPPLPLEVAGQDAHDSTSQTKKPSPVLRPSLPSATRRRSRAGGS